MEKGGIQKGIIYCRVSSLEQVDGTSLDSQERFCREYAQKEGIEVSAVFIERGESAKTADRTEFIKAIAFCSDKKNQIKYFIVYKIDRFSRNQTDYAIIKQKLKKHGTEIRSASEKIDDTPSGQLMEIMIAGFAQFDNSVRAERCVDGMKARLKQGKWVWEAPIGYYRILKGGNLTPDPKYAPYIRLAFEEYAKGHHTFESLAKYLKDRGFSTRNGYAPTRQLVEIIIKNPLYCGIIRKWDVDRKGAFEPLIDEKLFYTCQRAGKRRRYTTHIAKNPAFPLRKLVVCKSCKQSFTGSYCTGRQAKYPYYHHSKQNCESAKFIPKKSFEELFVKYLNEINPTYNFEKAFREVVMDKWKNDYKQFSEMNKGVQKEIEELKLKRQYIYELFESKTYTKEEFMAQREVVNQKIAQKEVLMLGKQIEGLNIDDALEHCFGFIRNTAETWLGLEKKPETRLLFQNLMFDENVIFSDGKFGTAQLTPVYKVYQEYLEDPSRFVDSVIRNWNNIIIHLRNFQNFMGGEKPDHEVADIQVPVAS